MKIIAWNLKNIGRSKLTYELTQPVVKAGYGNNVLDYITKVATADTLWSKSGVVTAPADIFVIIELKSGGDAKGSAVSGAAAPVLTSISNGMNTIASTWGSSSPFSGKYHWSFVTPLVTGYHECVGLIYNDKALTYDGKSSVVLKDVGDKYLGPRTPWAAKLTFAGTTNSLVVVGIHAPPPGSGGNGFKDPVSFAVRLSTISAIAQATANKQAVGIMGDFNCTTTDSYQGLAGKISPFTTLFKTYGYSNQIDSTALTSLRATLDNENMKPDNYLSGAYDNILVNFTGGTGSALDLIGNSAIYDTNLKAVFNNYWKVSDHMPVLSGW